MNECLDDALKELRAVGIEPEVAHGGKHIRIFWQHNGQARSHTVPVSPSDWRTPLNNRSQVLAKLRADGLLDTGEAPPDAPRVALKDGLPFCSSLDVARHFDKAHKDILRAIDRLAMETGQEFNRRNFTPIEYVDGRGRKQRSFDMTRDGFSLLVMGFTGAAATAWKIKYIDAFNLMDAEIRRVAAHLPDEFVRRIEKIEGDLTALIDLSLVAPTPEPGYTIVRAHRRKLRAAQQ